jgi:HAE1 family hydrophobic/amphiphilic exporter-1
VGLAVTSSTLTSIVVFLPLAFLVGLFAVLLGELALTVVFSLSLSVVVSLTIVPLLSYKLMHTETKKRGLSFIASGWQNLFSRLLDLYRQVIRWALRNRLLTILAATVILILFVRFIPPLLDVELLPAINQGEFRMELTLPEGTRIEITDEMAKQIENNLSARSDIAQVYSQVGIFSARGELKSNFATLTINLKENKAGQITAVMDELRRQYTRFPGTKVVIRQTDVTEGMRREPVNVRIFGDDLPVLDEIGQRLIPEIENIPGVVNLNSTLQEGLSEFSIHIDRTRANDLGLNFRQVSGAIRSAVLGNSDTRLSTHGKEYDITVKVDENQLQNLNDLLDLPLVNNRGTTIPLRAVADIHLQKSPSEIKRLDQQRMLEIKADVAGRSQRQVAAEVKAAVGQINLPPDYYIGFGGQSRAIGESFRSLILALVIAIFLVYVVMGAQFNSFIHPFTIAFTIPLAVIGVLSGLLVFGASLSMNALLGMILLVGIVVNNGIILIDYINQLRARGMEKTEAIVEAGATRLRPIFITSLTTIFGMLPIALGLGKGGEALQPLGAVVSGGLTTSTFLTLIVIPCVYSLLDNLHKSK